MTMVKVNFDGVWLKVSSGNLFSRTDDSKFSQIETM